LPAIFQLSRALTKAGGFIPAHLRNEGEIAAVILAGRELGLPPMTSLRSLSLIKGKVTLAADVQLALMVRAGARIKWLSDGANGVAQLELARPGHEPYTSTYTIDDATRAGLASQENYRKHQGAMLRARAVSAAARAYMPDVLAGCYVPGELDDDVPVRPVSAPKGRQEDSGDSAEQRRLQDSAECPADPETGEVKQPAYTTRMHADKLKTCETVQSLVEWLHTLDIFDLSDERQRAAMSVFSAHCGKLGIDSEDVTRMAYATDSEVHG